MSLPPAHPEYIFRGHAAQIHAIKFIRGNTRLITGDANGWVVLWNAAIRRPVVVWKAHATGPILGLSAWGEERIITHGKDNKLIVWSLPQADDASMSVVLPVDTAPEPRRQPWSLYILEVNTMNFCSFAKCPVLGHSDAAIHELDELLIAVPNTVSSETVDIFHLPSSKRIHTVPNPPSFQGGMVMAVALFYQGISRDLILVSAYESGHTIVSRNNPSTETWQALYLSKPHSQPILSLDVTPDKSSYLTSSADAVIAKHTIPPVFFEKGDIDVVSLREESCAKVLKTGHSGQQSLRIRCDGKIFATAGWDGRVRVYGVKTMKELAVLKWHKEGCYSVAFAEVEKHDERDKSTDALGTGKDLVEQNAIDLTVKERRETRARNGHWLAVGSKDAKISLWEIY